jgi:hypothetical protein
VVVDRLEVVEGEVIRKVEVEAVRSRHAPASSHVGGRTDPSVPVARLALPERLERPPLGPLALDHCSTNV